MGPNTHVLNRGPAAVRSPHDRLATETVAHPPRLATNSHLHHPAVIPSVSLQAKLSRT